MTTTEIGQKAEKIAADFLARKGCDIVARNWRTRRCEIDIVAHRKGIVYFCEVKYRASPTSGTGIEYITTTKLKQMRFAAQSWAHAHAWRGDMQLCAIEVSGPSFQVTNVVKDLG